MSVNTAIDTSQCYSWSKEKKAAYEEVLINPEQLSNMKVEFKKDRSIVLTAVKGNGMALKYAHETMRSRKDIAEVAISNIPYSAQFLSNILKKDDKFMTTMIRRYSPKIIEYASDKLKSDKFFIKELVTKDGSLLEFASEELKNDPEICKLAIRNYYQSFQFCSKELKNEKSIITYALKFSPKVFMYASENIKKDKKYIQKQAKKYPGLMSFISKELLEDSTFIHSLLPYHVYRYLPEKLRYDFELTLEAVRLNGLNLEFTSLNNNLEIASAALKENGTAYFYLNEELKENLSLITLAVKKNKQIFCTLPEEIQSNFEIYVAHHGMYVTLNEKMNFKDIKMKFK